MGCDGRKQRKEKSLFGGVDEHEKKRKVALERRTKIRRKIVTF